MRGILLADKLLGNQVDLAFIARCNDAIDVEIENQMRRDMARRRKEKR